LGIFFLCSPNCPKQPRTSFLFYKFFYPIVSAKVSALIPPVIKFIHQNESGKTCYYGLHTTT
jgi:hypothetical protein